MTFKSRRHRRRFHTERIIDKRLRRYKREASQYQWESAWPDPGYIYPPRPIDIYSDWRKGGWYKRAIDERKPGTSPKVQGNYITGWRLSRYDYWRSRCGKQCMVCHGEPGHLRRTRERREAKWEIDQWLDAMDERGTEESNLADAELWRLSRVPGACPGSE